MAIGLDNCPRCGRLYARGLREMCPACVRVIEEEYERCVKYLRENRGATIHELSEAVNVTVRQITKFIREGRISLLDAPNMSYPCEVCGFLIREGGLCDACRQRLAKDMRNAEELDRKRRELDQALKQAHTYRINE